MREEPATDEVKDLERSLEDAAGSPAAEAVPDAADDEAAPVAGEDASGAAPALDYLDDLKRLQAEFANYRKRMMKEQTSAAERASGRLVELLLPVLDNFERAIGHGEGGPGVELVFRELKEVLASEGLREIDAGEGRAFDPTIHEAVESVDDPDATELTCRSVYRRGYMLGDRVLRPAMVVVSRPVETDGGTEGEARADDDASRTDAAAEPATAAEATDTRGE